MVRGLLRERAMHENRLRMHGGEVVAHRFVIDERVGAGGMGTVYRAHDRVSGAPVAVKVVTDDALHGGARFTQEARILCELEHPAIVRYIAHGSSEDGRSYLVMEWLEGEDLAHRLSRGPLPIEEAIDLCRRVADALASAHARGIVHRDVKPANVFLTEGHASHVKVLDFGIARTRLAGGLDTTVMPITRTGAVIGTVGYMSPEQARGATDVDARTDVFAMGCVLFECLTGRPAFSGANAVAVLAKVLIEDAPRVRTLRPEIPSNLDELVAKMLAKQPGQRPSGAAAVASELAAVRASGSLSLPRPSSGGLAEREQRLVSIVLARGIDAKRARSVLADVEPFELADGALLFALRGADPVNLAASAAIALREIAPDAAISVATGRIDTSHDGLLGPVIDRAATTLAKPGEIALDVLSSSLLFGRYEIAGDESQRRLIGFALHSAEPRTLLGKRTPCVGRDKELALLQATFEECASEPIARVELVTAPAGCGKSRLQHELLGRVGGDATVLFARSDPMGAGSSLGIVRQLVRSAAGVREGDALATQREALRAHLSKLFVDEALDRGCDMLGELIGAPPVKPGLVLRAARDDARILSSWLRRAFAEWLAALCDAGPVLIAVEDLHWGDRTSVAYLEEALRNNAARPLMVLALARPEVHDLFPDLWARVGCQELRLPALTKRAAEKLVKSVLSDADDETVLHLVDRAEGNAFYLEELIRHVAEGGAGSLPETVLALAEARVARVDPERRRALRAASIFGEVFWADAVSSLLDGSESAGAALRAMVEDELLVERATSKFPGVREYAFRHGLLRDVAYAILTDEDRARGHHHAGEWLERAGEKDMNVLADHFERAGDRPRAAVFLEMAVQRAFEAFDIRAAMELTDRVLRTGVDGERLGRLRVVQSMAATIQGDPASATKYAKEAYGLLPRGSRHAYTAAGNVLNSGAYVGDFELAPEIVQDLLSGDPTELSGPYGLALQMVVAILDSLGQRESAERLLERGQRFADESPDADRAFVGWLGYARAGAFIRRDDLGSAFRAARDALEAFALVNDPFGTAVTRFGFGLLQGEIGQPSRQRAHLREASTFFRRMGASMMEMWCAIHEGWSYFDERRYDDAVAAVVPVFHHFDHRHARVVAAFAHLEKGEIERAEEHVDKALAGIDDFLVTPWVVTLVHAARAATLRARGRHPQALESLSRALEAGHGLLPPYVRSLVEVQRIESLFATGDRAAARAELSLAVARIERVRAALDAECAETFVRVWSNARMLALAADQSP
jgi:tetratricopeptide (TPR) repeat protein